MSAPFSSVHSLQAAATLFASPSMLAVPPLEAMPPLWQLLPPEMRQLLPPLVLPGCGHAGGLPSPPTMTLCTLAVDGAVAVPAASAAARAGVSRDDVTQDDAAGRPVCQAGLSPLAHSGGDAVTSPTAPPTPPAARDVGAAAASAAVAVSTADFFALQGRSSGRLRTSSTTSMDSVQSEPTALLKLGATRSLHTSSANTQQEGFFAGAQHTGCQTASDGRRAVSGSMWRPLAQAPSLRSDGSSGSALLACATLSGCASDGAEGDGHPQPLRPATRVRLLPSLRSAFSAPGSRGPDLAVARPALD